MKPVQAKPPSLGTALVVKGNPTLFPAPPRPNMRTGRVGYRRGHPMLTSPAQRPALPAGATSGGANQALLNQYVAALRGGK